MFLSFHNFVQEIQRWSFDVIIFFASILGVVILGGLVIGPIVIVIHDLVNFIKTKIRG